MALKMHRSLAVHPGPWLRTEIVEPADIRVGHLAAALKVSRQAVSAILSGRASLSADMALRLEQALGVSADTLMRMQTTYDLAQARQHDLLPAIQRLIEAA
jgi:antitoxin HigA-1